MDYDAKERIRIRCQDSIEQSVTLKRLFLGVRPNTLRADWARCAIDLAIEHHSAIVSLILHGHYGSAGALLRPLLESGACAYWFMYAADCDWVRDLDKTARGESTRDVPALDDMLKQIETRFSPVLEIRKGLKNNGPATWLHKFTHGGVLQLIRRDDADLWSEKDICTHLLCADIFSVVAAAVGTAIADVPDLAEYVFPRRDELGEKMADFFGLPPAGSQPHHLPKPLLDGCGPSNY